MTLNEIGVKYGTDKSSIYHNYLDFYASFFEPIRNEKLNVLEIGIKDGASIKMWREYFHNAFIAGIDIVEVEPIEDCSLLTCDATKPNPFSEIEWDIVIDDGSHFTADQIAAFNLYKWKRFFVMEDLHTSFILHYINTNETTFDYLTKERQFKHKVHSSKPHLHDSLTMMIWK